MEVNNMQADELFRVSVLGDTSFNQSNLIPAKPVRANLDDTKPDIATMIDSELLLIPISFMIVWSIIVFMYSDVWIVARHEIFTIFHLYQVPCRKCQFFKNNPYLRCAVHPTTALTSEAIHCSDYCPQNGR
jgi:hypothetical protein